MQQVCVWCSGAQNGELGGGVSARPERTRWQRKAEQLRPKLAVRRHRMQMLRRAPHEHTEALARSNSVRSSRQHLPCAQGSPPRLPVSSLQHMAPDCMFAFYYRRQGEWTMVPSR